MLTPGTISICHSNGAQTVKGKSILFSSIILAASILAAPASAAGEFLTGEEVRNRLDIGNLALKTSADYEFPVAMTLKPDGSMEGVSGNGYYDVGRWWLRGDTLCHQWEGWFDGLRKCHGVVADGTALTLVKPTAIDFKDANRRLK